MFDITSRLNVTRTLGSTVMLGTMLFLSLPAATYALVPSPTLSLTANPAEVSKGGAATLSWTSKNTKSCTASGGWSGPKSKFGRQTVKNIISSQTYTLVCAPGTTMYISASVTVAVASTPPPPPPLAQAVVGVVGGRSHHDLLQDLHPQSIRAVKNWEVVEKQRGVYDWAGSGTDARMQFAKANNISAIGGLWYGNGLYPSVHAADDSQAEIGRQAMANYAKAMVQRYGPPNGPMQYVEVWNEWFGHLGPCEASCIDPVIYAKLLCDVHAAVKSVNPSVKVIGGAFAGSHGTTKFLGDVVNLGGDCMDLIAIHSYIQNVRNNPCHNGGNTDPVKGVSCFFDEYITRYDNIVKSHNGGKSIPFAVTEQGWSDHNTPAGEIESKTYMHGLYTRANRDPRIHGIWWYSFNPNPPNDRQRSYSVLDGSRKKPAFFEMKALARPTAK